MYSSEIGNKLLCKKSNRICDFTINVWYSIDRKISKDIIEILNDDNYSIQFYITKPFSRNSMRIDEHFYTQDESRKMKLEKINKL